MSLFGSYWWNLWNFVRWLHLWMMWRRLRKLHTSSMWDRQPSAEYFTLWMTKSHFSAAQTSLKQLLSCWCCIVSSGLNTQLNANVRTNFCRSVCTCVYVMWFRGTDFYQWSWERDFLCLSFPSSPPPVPSFIPLSPLPSLLFVPCLYCPLGPLYPFPSHLSSPLVLSIPLSLKYS